MIHFNRIHILSVFTYAFPLVSLTEILYLFNISHIHATCAAYLIPIYLITVIIFCEEYKL